MKGSYSIKNLTPRLARARSILYDNGPMTSREFEKFWFSNGRSDLGPRSATDALHDLNRLGWVDATARGDNNGNAALWSARKKQGKPVRFRSPRLRKAQPSKEAAPVVAPLSVRAVSSDETVTGTLLSLAVELEAWVAKIEQLAGELEHYETRARNLEVLLTKLREAL